MKICNSVHCEKLIRPKIDFIKEEFWCIALSSDFELVSFQRLAIGSTHQVLIPTAQIIQFVSQTCAKKVVLIHTHCKGVSFPSALDLHWTSRLKNLFELLEIQLCDHIILSKENSTSLLEWDPQIFD